MSSLSRRRFLETLASIGVVAKAGVIAPLGCSSAEASPALDELERRLPGRVLRPGSPEYAEYTTPWNLRWTGERPIAQAVVRATSAADVATALKWANETGTPIVARSGGHSYAGYSTTTGVTIDVSSMTNVAYDASTGRATLGGGVRNAHVYAELAKVERTVTHGRCYGVGVAGLVLGGGIGFNMRRIGLTCDQLASTEVVLASGEIVRASATENDDLFWAARGAGGGQFGIHTSFVFDTHPAPDVVAFDRTFKEKLDELVPALFTIAREAPRALGLKITVRVTPGADGKNAVVLNLLGQWVGPRADFDAWFAPLLAIATPDPALGFVREDKYWPAQKDLSDKGEKEFMYERSRYAIEPLDDRAAAKVLESLRAWPGTKVSASWKGFLTGGAVSDVAPDATAFVHRRDWLLTTTDLNWSTEDDPARVLAALEWVDALHEDMRAFTSDETYQNFIDESQTDWPKAYHGANFDRLVGIKRKYDPRNVFRFAQSIPV